MIRRGLSIFGWIITIASVAALLGLIGLMIYIDSEMGMYCVKDSGFHHSGECKDLGSLGRVVILAIGLFFLLASIQPAIHFISKSRQKG